MTFQELKDQLTKPIGTPKTSGAPNAPKRRLSPSSDIVGIELGSGDARGCPAVRLVRGNGNWTIRAVGFVPPPNGSLPNSWKELDRQPTWTVSPAFAAPYAAVAVNSPDQVVRQTTLESLTDGSKKKIEPGTPIAQDGLRLAVESLGEGSFVLESGIPEYQLLWLSRLFTEGRRPTACSIQTAPTAMLASLVEQPEFHAVGGNAAALFMMSGTMYFVGFRAGAPVLFREFPGVGGVRKIREALRSGFGMEEKMVDEVLDDTLIDPSPILKSIINPVLRQLELSLDYLKSRLNVSVDKVFLMGLPSGAKHWSRMSEQALNMKLFSPGLFDGVEIPSRVSREAEALLKRSHVFMSAYGAARAALEVQT